jgi:hypothetical protein
MTTEAERREMTEEVRRLMEERGVHPWVLFQDALKGSDKDAAEAVIEAGYSRLSSRQKIASQQALKRTFPPEQPEFKNASEKKDEQDEAANNSPVAAALESRLKARREKAKHVNETSKRYAGPNVDIPIDEQHLYAKPDRSGFNTPVGDEPTRKGAGRAKIANYAPPKS